MRLEDQFDELIDAVRRHPLIVEVSVVSRPRIGDEGYIRLVARFINGGELTFSSISYVGRLRSTPTPSRRRR